MLSSAIQITLRSDMEAELGREAAHRALDRGPRESFSGPASPTPGLESPVDHRTWSVGVTCEFGLLPESQTFCMGPAEEVAPAVSFFASEGAGFVTGQRIVVDGVRSVHV